MAKTNNNSSYLKKQIGRMLYILGWPAIWLIIRFGGPRSRVVVKVGDQVLLIKDVIGDGTWKLPGGGKNYGEKLIDCALRELREETGITADGKDLLPIGIFNSTRVKGIVLHTYGLKLSTKPRVQIDFKEIAEFAWVSLKDAESYEMSNSTRDMLTAFSDH